MDLTVLTYVVYLVISVGLAVWVGRTLGRAGRVFLADVFHGDDKLADAVNHLLVVGFYLVNLGFDVLWLKTTDSIPDAQSVFTELSIKIGTVLLVLGGLHLGNVFILNRMRLVVLDEGNPQPPVRPTRRITPPAATPRPSGPGKPGSTGPQDAPEAWAV